METKKNNANILAAIILAIAIMVSSYLIALGFRYEKIGDSFILDKWTKQLYLTTGQKFRKLGD